jgi:hypothetical protein
MTHLKIKSLGPAAYETKDIAVQMLERQGHVSPDILVTPSFQQQDLKLKSGATYTIPLPQLGQLYVGKEFARRASNDVGFIIVERAEEKMMYRPCICELLSEY